MALKKRKLYENQLEAVENNIMRVNEQQMMLENQRTTVETVAALSNAAKASKQTMHEMKIENVDKVRFVCFRNSCLCLLPAQARNIVRVVYDVKQAVVLIT